MDFTAKYTTAALISADKEGIEAKKTEVSQDTYAIGDVIQNLIHKIENLRLSLT